MAKKIKQPDEITKEEAIAILRMFERFGITLDVDADRITLLPHDGSWERLWRCIASQTAQWRDQRDQRRGGRPLISNLELGLMSLADSARDRWVAWYRSVS